MAMDWSYPLAPAVFLLLGAFLMQTVGPRLPALLRYYLTLLIPAAMLPILANPNFRSAADQAPTVLSGWGQSGALTLRVDGFSLVFLMLVALLLFVLCLAEGPVPGVSGRKVGLMFAVAAAASLIFVAANGLTASYALLLFDAVGAVFWLARRRVDLAVLRLLLSLFSAAALALFGLPAAASFSAGLLAVAWWLRLGLYPYLEAGIAEVEDDSERILWVALSTAVAIYLVARFPAGEGLPAAIYWLVALVMALNGLKGWLTAERTTLLVHLALVQASLVLLAGPLAGAMAAALALTVSTGLAALWLTPRLGRPNLAERSWPWLYAAPALATLSLLGVPFTLGWIARSEIYGQALDSEYGLVVTLAVLAEGLALAGLWRYWRDLLRPAESNGLASAAGLVAAVPFLVPGVAAVVLEALTKEAAATRFDWPLPVLLAMGAIWLWAIFLGAGRGRWLARSPLWLGRLEQALHLEWAIAGLGRGLDYLARFILRVRLMVEGEHYLGWALLVTLTGVILWLLR